MTPSCCLLNYFINKILQCRVRHLTPTYVMTNELQNVFCCFYQVLIDEVFISSKDINYYK